MRTSFLLALVTTSLLCQSAAAIDSGLLAKAQGGDAEAQYKLGYAYEHEGPRSYVDAVKWFQKAAAQGHARAQFYLGMSYETGQLVPQNFSEAYVWYSLSAAFGKDNALSMEYRDNVAKRLSPESIERAQSRAKKLHAEIISKSKQ